MKLGKCRDPKHSPQKGIQEKVKHQCPSCGVSTYLLSAGTLSGTTLSAMERPGLSPRPAAGTTKASKRTSL